MRDFCEIIRLDKDSFVEIKSERETIRPMVSIRIESHGVGQDMLLSPSEFIKFAAIVREAEAGVRVVDDEEKERRGGEPHDKTINITITKKVRDTIDQISSATGASLSAVARKMIYLGIESYYTPKRE